MEKKLPIKRYRSLEPAYTILPAFFSSDGESCREHLSCSTSKNCLGHVKDSEAWCLLRLLRNGEIEEIKEDPEENLINAEVNIQSILEDT